MRLRLKVCWQQTLDFIEVAQFGKAMLGRRVHDFGGEWPKAAIFLDLSYGMYSRKIIS